VKTRLLVLVAALALLGLGAMTAPAAHAGTQATCWSTPTSGPIGTVFTVYCAGFSRDTILNTYYVEPDGAAVILGDFKTNEVGSIAVAIATKYGTFGAASVGNWTVVADQKGLANSIIAHAEAVFRVTGGTEGVSGAKVWTDPTSIHPGQFVTVYGSGFAANEVVSSWVEFPNGDCSSFTFHDFYYNGPGIQGLSSEVLFDAKADGSGSFAFSFYFYSLACEGRYRVVARGNSSGLGGETTLTLQGNAITLSTTASLTASPNVVAATMDWVYFTGSGFGANSPVSCWIRTPHGQVTAVDQLWQPPTKSDASGNFSFSIYTGSFVPQFIVASEGALGTYTMTCKGETTGAIATADFRVTGGTFTP
jgi:hypothetical protein